MSALLALLRLLVLLYSTSFALTHNPGDTSANSLTIVSTNAFTKLYSTGNCNCQNGALCKVLKRSLPAANGDYPDYFCDCASIAFLPKYDSSKKIKFVGRLCEHVVPYNDFCENSSDFCLNGGVCKHKSPKENVPKSANVVDAIVAEKTEENEMNQCDCPGQFLGKHCEYDVGQIPSCNMDCGVNGVCRLRSNKHLDSVNLISLGTKSENSDLVTTGTTSVYCECFEGYTGARCETSTTLCPDGLTVCLYESQCVATETYNGDPLLGKDAVVTSFSYKCDCAAIDREDCERIIETQLSNSHSDSRLLQNIPSPSPSTTWFPTITWQPTTTWYPTSTLGPTVTSQPSSTERPSDFNDVFNDDDLDNLDDPGQLAPAPSVAVNAGSSSAKKRTGAKVFGILLLLGVIGIAAYCYFKRNNKFSKAQRRGRGPSQRDLELTEQSAYMSEPRSRYSGNSDRLI